MIPIFTFVWQCLLISTVYGAPDRGICFPCRCEDSPPQMTVNCSSLGLLHTPSGLPSNLTKLILHNNRIYNINKSYFGDFPNITELDLSYNVDLGMDNVSKAFYGLRDSNISIINITSVVKEYSYKNCVILKSDFFKYLTNTSLKTIYMDRNWIHLIEPNSFKMAPHFLEFISLTQSRLVFSFDFFFEMQYLKNLRKIFLGELNSEELIFPKNNKTREFFFLKNTHRIRKQRAASLTSLENIFIPLPPKLEEINFDSSAVVASIPKLTFSENKVKTLSLRRNIIQPIIGPVYGLDELETFDLSDNNCDTFPANASAVINMPKLRYLYLKGNNFDFTKKENFLEHYQNLIVLDVSYNKVSILPETLSDKLSLLEELNMKGNIIYIFSVDLRNLRNLRILDISENKISVLSDTITSQLDFIRKSTNLTLDLTGNPIRCSCDDSNLRFIRWLAHTNVNIRQKSTLSCLIEGEIRKVIEQYIAELERKCESPTRYYSLAMGTSIAITGLMSFMIMGLIYRYRYKLAYIYFIGRRSYRQRAANEDDCNMLEFDAYIAYADEDRQFAVHTFRQKLELGHQLNLCFKDRDFLPGEVIASSIVSAIQRSRRIVLVLSPEFLKSGWRRYEFEMAHCESIERARDMIVLVKYKDIPLRDVPKEMLRMLHSQTYLEFPETEEDQQTFWETMKERISEM